MESPSGYTTNLLALNAANNLRRRVYFGRSPGIPRTGKFRTPSVHVYI